MANQNGSIARALVASIIIAVPAILAVHWLSAALRAGFDSSAPAIAGLLAACTAVILLGSVPLWRRSSKLLHVMIQSAGMAVVAVVAVTFMRNDGLIPALALLLICPAASAAGRWLTSALPSSIDDTVRRRRLRAVLWLVLGLLTVLQVGRLSSWMVAPSDDWWLTTRDPLYAEHQCMNAYVYAADLNRQGVENIYDGSLYPGLNPEVVTQATVQGLQPEDPYQYPPPFLLLPRAGLALTNSYDTLRLSWFVLQVVFFLAVCWRLARSVLGREGVAAAWLIPAVLVSVPILTNFQYGQFHLFSVALGVLAILLFERRQPMLGGAALAFAILSKIAPGILILWLAARRRWADIGWTVAFCGVFSLLGYLVLGPQPYVAFVEHQLPQLMNGSAFAFADVWPEYHDILIVSNQAPATLPAKLALLGFSWSWDGLSGFLHTGYSAAVAALAVYAGLKLKNPRAQALVALALLNLAGLTSRGAWGDYISVGSVWLLSFVVLEMGRSWAARISLGICWLFLFLSLGVVPFPGIALLPTAAVLSILGFLTMIALNTWFILGRRERATA